MGPANDYDEIAAGIGQSVDTLLGEAHAPDLLHEGDHITITKNGFLAVLIELQRLRTWAEKLAEQQRALGS